MSATLSVSLFVLLAIVFFAVASYQARARLQAWRAFAARHGLRFHESIGSGTPRLTGAWQGVPVIVQIEHTGSSENRKTWTRISAQLGVPLPLGLAIGAEGLADRVAKLFGGQDIQLGVPELDRCLRVRGDDARAVRALLSNWRVRQAVVAFVQGGDGVVSQHRVLVSLAGFQDSSEVLARTLDRVARTAREIEAGREGPPQPAAPTTAALPAAPAPVVPPSAVPSAAPSLLPPIPPPVLPAAPEPPPSPRSPAAAPTPGTAPAAPADLADLARLGERSLSTAERQALAARLGGRPIAFTLVVERVALTSDPGLAPTLAHGRTAIGKAEGTAGPRLFVRLPDTLNARAEGLGWGDRIQIEAHLRSWDDFYRQATLETAPGDGNVNFL